jgi:hypothetical protein
MRKTVWLAAVVSSLWFVIGSAQAAPSEGANELQVAGGFFHAEDSDVGSLNADLSYGFYVTPGWQVGLRQAVNYNFVDDERDFWVATTAPFINYNFRVTDIIVLISVGSSDSCGTIVTRRGPLGLKAASNFSSTTRHF